jgi:hypothetical protein
VSETIERVPALGGTRLVPAPDPIAADYLMLGLRFDQHMPGIVDGYYGPADLKARADMEQLRAPARLLDDVAALSERIDRDVEAIDRRDWLTAQLGALDAHARALAAAPLPYAEYVERCLGFAPSRHSDAAFDLIAAEIDALLPGPGSISDRLDAWDRSIEIPPYRLLPLAEWLLGRFRDRARELFGLPHGESMHVTTVTDQPWMAYDWYLGGLRSRVEINVDLPVTAIDLVVTLGHEAYPGHHLEAAWRETDLVERERRLEVSMILTNTPEGPVSEGLARYGTRYAASSDERPDLLFEIFERAGLPIAATPAAARDIAERTVRIHALKDRLEAATDEAALRRYVDGASSDEVLEYLHEVGRYRPKVAAKRLAFLEDPLSRLYVFAYEGGESLVEAWVERAEAPDRVGRFGRLLHEQVTPGRLRAESG